MLKWDRGMSVHEQHYAIVKVLVISILEQKQQQEIPYSLSIFDRKSYSVTGSKTGKRPHTQNELEQSNTTYNAVTDEVVVVALAADSY